MSSPSAPRIGITVYGPDREPELPVVSLPWPYVSAVANAGGLPLLLPPVRPIPERLLDSIDGLILSGGGDIDPALHTAARHPTVYMVSPERDAFEVDLMRGALARPEIPVLGICRGMQILNIALGGSLELHLPDAHGEAVAHRAPPRQPIVHSVQVEPESRLEAIYGQRSFDVCSWHHQGVRQLGHGLEPIAHAPDGVIEALIHTELPFVLGVQWHPEMQAETDPLQRRLFEAFVTRAALGSRAMDAGGARAQDRHDATSNTHPRRAEGR